MSRSRRTPTALILALVPGLRPDGVHFQAWPRDPGGGCGSSGDPSGAVALTRLP